MKLDTEGFGRILAQVAKQVIIQRVREAERGIVFDEYKDRKGEVVNGIVRRFEKGSLIVDLGRAEAVLPAKEQVQRESYRPGDRIRAYVIDVNKEAKGPQIILSRASIELLEQALRVRSARDLRGHRHDRVRGARSRACARRSPSASRDSDVDPVGACVGMKGSRVQSVVQELRGERIDIVPWSPDPARYVCSALSPAQVSKVIIDEGAKSMDVIVPDDQLSLAIGRKGQNVRLAVQLTGWRIDIKSESKMREIAAWLAQAVSVVDGWGEPEAEILLNQGVTSLDDLSQQPVELLMQLPGIDEAGVHRRCGSARRNWRPSSGASTPSASRRKLPLRRPPRCAALAGTGGSAGGVRRRDAEHQQLLDPQARRTKSRRMGTTMAKIRAYKIAEELGLDRNESGRARQVVGRRGPGADGIARRRRRRAAARAARRPRARCAGHRATRGGPGRRRGDPSAQACARAGARARACAGAGRGAGCARSPRNRSSRPEAAPLAEVHAEDSAEATEAETESARSRHRRWRSSPRCDTAAPIHGRRGARRRGAARGPRGPTERPSDWARRRPRRARARRRNASACAKS